MQTAELVAFAIFGSYFLIILGLFGILGRNVAIVGGGRTLRQYVFSGLTIMSFAHTWYYMLAYLLWSFSRYQQASGSKGGPFIRQMAEWLINTGLFEEAWSKVSARAMPWWLSEPICLFTVGAWTIFLATKGRQHAVKHLWAYMALGQLVAISVATNLFFLSILLTPIKKSTVAPGTKLAPPILWLSVLVALLTVGISPYTDDKSFLPNLLVMHFFIFLPLLPIGYNTNSSLSIRTKTLYALAAVAAVVLRLRTTYAALTSLPPGEQTLWGFVSAAATTLHTHPAQSSIGWDVVWTTVSVLLWITLRPASSLSSLSKAGITSLLFSAGVSAPLAFREDVDEPALARPKTR